MASIVKTLMLAGVAAGTAGLALAQAPTSPSATTGGAQPAAKPFAAPGTPGSEIDGTLFHAQVLMSAHGFSPGVIDGKAGESFRLALRSFRGIL